jgi:hypothetical protein
MSHQILEEREATHGSYENVAITAQHIKIAMRAGINYEEIDPVLMESLDMIASKISRIVNGDSNYKDHWDDIAGYALLISKELKK